MTAENTQSLAARADLQALQGMTIAVLGYGAQGHAHALNLRDCGCHVIVAQRQGSPRYAAAVDSGFLPVDIGKAVQTANLLIFALPDEVAPLIYKREIAARLRPGQALGFLHGFNIHYDQIVPSAGTDVILVAPKAQGHAVRSEFLAGRGVAALVAVHQDATGRALDRALGWAAGIGAARAAILKTTFAAETETDLFGEQVVLCGGLSALIKAGFETLVDAGYPAELAYLECCHEVKLIADLIYEGGLTYMRERISNTARFGDLTRGPRVIGPAARAAMREILDEIRSGRFAREWLEENGLGLRRLKQLTDRDRAHAIEQVGDRLRRMMRGESA